MSHDVNRNHYIAPGELNSAASQVEPGVACVTAGERCAGLYIPTYQDHVPVGESQVCQVACRDPGISPAGYLPAKSWGR